MYISWLGGFITYFALLGLTDLDLFRCLGISSVVFIVLIFCKK